jgi:hypothetical protein
MPTVTVDIHRNAVQRIVWSIVLALLLLLALAFALAEPVWADPGKAQLGGRVVDVLGKPVAGANVHVAEAAVSRIETRSRLFRLGPGIIAEIRDPAALERSSVMRSTAVLRVRFSAQDQWPGVSRDRDQRMVQMPTSTMLRAWCGVDAAGTTPECGAGRCSASWLRHHRC